MNTVKKTGDSPNIKNPYYQYRDSDDKDKTVPRPSYWKSPYIKDCFYIETGPWSCYEWDGIAARTPVFILKHNNNPKNSTFLLGVWQDGNTIVFVFQMVTYLEPVSLRVQFANQIIITHCFPATFVTKDAVHTLKFASICCVIPLWCFTIASSQKCCKKVTI